MAKLVKKISDLTTEESSLVSGSFNDITELRSSLRKEFGNSSAINDDEFVTDFIKTGIDPLDFLLGGGLPQGKMVEIVGKEGVGKSSFGIHMLAQAQKLGGVGVLIDTEGGVGDRFRLNQFGVDPSQVIISIEDLAEKAFATVEKTANHIIKKNIKAPSLLIIDSVAGLTTKSEQEADLESNSYALAARMIKKGIQKTKMLCRESNLAVIFINQSRVKIGGMVNMYTGPEMTSPGGDTLKFQALTRVFLDRGKFLGESKTPQGHIVKMKFIKCKTSPALNRTLNLRFYYDKREYDNITTVYDVLNDAGYMGAGAWKTVVLPDGTEKKFNSESTFIDLWNACPENREHFISMMKDCFNKNLSFNSNEEETPLETLTEDIK